MATEGHAREAKQKAIIACLEKGGTRRAAIRSAGCGSDTFYRWLAEYPTFSNEVLRAEANAELEDTELIRTAAKTDWRAAAWLHEHHPQRREEWKKANEIDWRSIPAEVLFALLGGGSGDPGVESTGDRMAAEAGSRPDAE